MTIYTVCPDQRCTGVIRDDGSCTSGTCGDGRERINLRERLGAALDYLQGQRLALLDEADRLGITLHTLRNSDGSWPGLDLLVAEAALIRALIDIPDLGDDA